MKRFGAVVAVASAACVLVSCGSSEVSDESSSQTIAPLTRSASPSVSAASSSAVATKEEGRSGSAAAPNRPLPTDEGAREVTEVPTPELQLSDADKAYLDELKYAGIKVEGVENQMIGAAQVVCGEQFPAAIHAVAGQLIEQQRTSLSPEQATAVLEQAARKSYC
ncbi:DUF732 domain-containing protein [Corynebacterium felinum]|uniref:DUF732 domain-containing protein n=1 Tax=Corynebacterium felinum TaxID=131318 RepID=A0ABU2B5Z9_9CORY|nr:DUF732 domain-containing protein [Corynebacterium felinum]MDF5821513.1 DUF732 domain-containing protein [Corynebacterium felinum]MDR7354033.1 hypothetical protein [Corynebacterium felinum]WJY96207.1 hypothetical protein CFELI_13140 [Corynebacterium felinum]